MENFIVVSPADVNDDNLGDFVRSEGGDWFFMEAVGWQGTISRRKAHVYLDLEPDVLSQYEQDELEQLVEELGSEPRSMISIHIGHQSGSRDLALLIAQKVQARWGGIVDLEP